MGHTTEAANAIYEHLSAVDESSYLEELAVEFPIADMVKAPARISAHERDGELRRVEAARAALRRRHLAGGKSGGTVDPSAPKSSEKAAVLGTGPRTAACMNGPVKAARRVS